MCTGIQKNIQKGYVYDTITWRKIGYISFFRSLCALKDNCSYLLCLVQVQLRTEVLRTPSLTRLGFNLTTTSRSWQYISCHWDACSNHLAISDFLILGDHFSILLLGSLKTSACFTLCDCCKKCHVILKLWVDVNLNALGFQVKHLHNWAS